MRLRSASLALSLLLASCGYHLAGSQSGLPKDIHSIQIGNIENRSREYGIEKSFAFALEREIMIRRQFRLADGDEAGDAVLSGRIRNVVFRPVAFNSNDLATQYEVTMIVDLKLKRQSDGSELWSVSALRLQTEYSASAGVMVWSSSQFQQQTLDPANLTNPQLSPQYATNPQSAGIQVAETDRKVATRRLLQQAARDIYNSMVENF